MMRDDGAGKRVDLDRSGLPFIYVNEDANLSQVQAEMLYTPNDESMND